MSRFRGLSKHWIITLLSVVIFVNVAFPKGGFYLSKIPITWGYLLLAVGAVSVLIIRNFSFRSVEIVQLLLVFAFGLINIAIISYTGVQDLATTADVASYLVSILVIPILTIIAVGAWARFRFMPELIRIWKVSLGIIFVWGLITFISYNFLKAYPLAGIPYLTLTGSDAASLLNRHIDRGVVVKMVSTYNNGNILGVNLLIWLPLLLYSAVASRWIAVVSRVCVFLTFSRSAWLGMIVLDLLCLLIYKRKLRQVLATVLLLPVLFSAIVFATSFWFDDPMGFIFAQNLGGRIRNLEALPLFTFSPGPFAQVSEIVPLSLMSNVGAFGVLLYYAVWLFPLVVPVRDRRLTLAKVGLALYHVVALMDGAFIYIPTQFTYWMLASLVLAGARWPDSPPRSYIPSIVARRPTRLGSSRQPAVGLGVDPFHA